MKTLLIIGILLMLTGAGLAYAGSQPMRGLSKRGETAMTASFVLGFLFLGGASVMHLNKKS